MICANNCGHHVAKALNLMKYNGKEDYNDITIMLMFVLRGKYVSYCHILKMYIPLIIIAIIITGIVLISIYS
jgi:hypothetical protein